jgi:hypothetical protein
MAKIVKLKQSDIENIVSNIIRENMEASKQPTDPFHRTKTNTSEPPTVVSLDMNEEDEMGNEAPEMGGKKVYMAKDENGTFYLVDAETNQAIGKSK